MKVWILFVGAILLGSTLLSQGAVTVNVNPGPQEGSAIGVQTEILLVKPRIPPNMTPIPVADDCKSSGTTCSGASDTSCCAGLSCHTGGTGQGWICF